MGELEEATVRGCPFTISQMKHRLQRAADKALSSAEELRDRQSKFDVQERGYLDDAIRLAGAEWARRFDCGSSGKIRELLDQDVADLTFMERSRENSKRRQAQ